MRCSRGPTYGTAVCILSALLFALPATHGYQSAPPDDLDELQWANLEVDVPSSRGIDSVLYISPQTMGADRAKRTGLVGGYGGMSAGGGGIGGPSLSIVNPLDVLRQRVALEIMRRKLNESKEKIQANRDMLDIVGKRSIDSYDYRRQARDTSRKPVDGLNALSHNSQHSRVSSVL
ncbi:uncharacterized protein Dh44 [Cloeon dipterum]